MPLSSEIIAAIIGGFFGVGGTLITLYATGGLRKSEAAENQASTANQVSLAWAQLIQPYQQQLASQNSKIVQQDAKIVEQDKTILTLQHRVELLETQLELLGAVPKTKGNKETR
jgi:hypothetical protein